MSGMSGSERPMRCPECGDDAIPQAPADQVPWEAHGMQRPEWSHRDGTSLCPVVGQSGYQPAQPEPKYADPEPSPSRAEADPAQPDPSATSVSKLQNQSMADQTAGPAREHGARIQAGTRSVIGHAATARMDAGTGELDRQTHRDADREAGS